MEGLLAATPASPYERCNVPSATCTSRERTDRASSQGDAHQCVPAGVSSGDECGVGDRHPTRHVRNGGKWRTELQIATWNVRGGMEQKMNVSLDVMDDRDLDVVCETETKRKGNNTTDLPGSRVAFWASVPESERSCQGVGVLLSFRLVSAVRLLWIRFKLGITRVFLLAAYAPVSSTLLGELEEFWESVRNILDSVRRNKKIIICGDLSG